MKLKHGSLFSGLDSFAIAARECGFENVFGCDNDFFSKMIFKNHNNEAVFFDDINNILKLPHTDVISFGFPCQDASVANPRNSKKNALHGKRTGLFYKATELISRSRPLFFVAENVPQVLKSGFEIFEEISEIGYNASWDIISARSFGADHLRERVFIIGQDSNNRKIRRDAHAIILDAVIAKREKNFVQCKFSGVLDEKIQPQINSTRCGEDYGIAERLHESFRISAIGNSIYLPIARAFMREIANQLNVENF